jgi:hypothetical protein
MACEMVDWLNGSIEWLFKRSTICLFGDIMACEMVDWLNGSIEWLFKRSTICLFGDIVVVKKTLRYSNVFFYNHLCRTSVFRNIIMKSGIKLKCKPLMGSVTVMKGFCPVNHLSNSAIEEGTHH